ncbi:MAG: ABC transporter ATP-binding protein [Candidatus Riflebacteria bacterium]|nr:ABC transporter ATP-binding protein [Candidatus Riflebacteria bacterium]
MSTAILVEHLSKNYENRNVVRNVSLSVEEGEIFGFLGPNGAGKTTSIRMIIGEISRDTGRIEIMGMSMPEDREKIKAIMGVVPDHQNLYDRLTVRQNLTLFARLYGVEDLRVEELIKLVDLVEHADIPTQKLSRGLRQRTLIARAILHRPKIFFLDEPTSALDPHSSLGIRNLIRILKDQGTTVFLTTHYMEEANSLCDRLAILHRGEITAIDTPKALRLRFGRPCIKVTLKDQISYSAPGESRSGEILELPLNDAVAAEVLAGHLRAGNVLTVHSQEATLEEVFLSLTGDSWRSSEDQAIQDGKAVNP